MSSSDSTTARPSSKLNDQTRADATHSSLTPSSPLSLPPPDQQPGPKVSSTSCSDHERTNYLTKAGFQNATLVDCAMSVSNSNVKATVDQSQDTPKRVMGFPTDYPTRMEQELSVDRPPFAPFFTIIKTGETIIHPRQVHYLFSDDDTSEALTAALLQSLFGEVSPRTSLIASADVEPSNDKIPPTTNSKYTRAINSSASHRDSGLKNKKEIDSNEKRSKPEERVIIVDLNSTGDAVVGVNSLSSKWQVVNAQIEKAPTWSGADDAKTEGNDSTLGNMMLKIDGVANSQLCTHMVNSVDSVAAGPASMASKGAGNSEETKRVPGEEEMRNLIESFDKKMDILRRVIGTRSRLDSQDTVIGSGGHSELRNTDKKT